MATLPRTNGPIFGSGFNFTPDQFPRAWDMTMEALEAGVSSGVSEGYSLALWGAGRLAMPDYFTGDAGAATPAGGALAVRLPPATYYLADEAGALHIVTLDDPLDLPVEIGLAGEFVYLQAVLVPDSGDEYSVEIKLISPTARPDLVESGYPLLGKLTTSNSEVTQIDVSVADVIWPLPLIQKRLKELAGPDEEVEGEVSAAQFNALRARVAQNEAEIARLKAQSATGTQDSPQSTELAFEHIALLWAGLAEVNPSAIERAPVAVVVATAGRGQNDTPDFSPDTDPTDPRELPWNPDTGTFGP